MYKKLEVKPATFIVKEHHIAVYKGKDGSIVKGTHPSLPAEYGSLGHHRCGKISVASMGQIEDGDYFLLCRSCGRTPGIRGQGWARGDAQKLHVGVSKWRPSG